MKKIITILTLSITMLTNAQLKTITYTDENQKLEGFLATPKTPHAKKVGILVIPAWMGIDEHANESAQKLAELGYYALVADIYGVGNNPENTTDAGKLSGFYKNNPLDYQKRIQLALDELVKAGANADEIAVIGYCFGGTGAIEVARGNLKIKGVVSFHGGLGKDAKRITTPIAAKVLVLHGADDPYVPAKQVADFQEEMKTAKADWQMIYYANAVHAFTHKDAGSDASKGAAYNQLADERSWQAMKTFFEELF